MAVEVFTSKTICSLKSRLKALISTAHSWYNVPRKGENARSEASQEVNFDFVYNAVGFHEHELFGIKDWINEPNFRQRVSQTIGNGRWPDGPELLSIMSDIYSEYEMDRKAHRDFNFRRARTVLKTLSQKFSQ